MNRFLLTLACLLSIAVASADAQLRFEGAPIHYGKAPLNDPIARLQKQIDAGKVTLEYDGKHGYLPGVLKALNVPRSSQMLVFSQTSFQFRKISPRRPRAIYFNDDVYVGWVQFGDVVEISAVDPEQGAIFYTLDQREKARPKFLPDRGQCIVCHASSNTQGVPGHLVRSVYPDADGRPQIGSGTFINDHQSPFKQRWGGWYVTGTHGNMRHMGNAIAYTRDDPDALDTETGANLTSLPAKTVNTRPYLEPGSDIVALMVLEHQTQMHNYMTLANFETRHAVHYDTVINKALGQPLDQRTATTSRRISAVADKLVRYLLFSREFDLTAPVEGTSTFAKDFAAQGPRDKKGRSLRDFDLKRRLFKYPCSYLIYSPAFAKLPAEVKDEVLVLLHDVLTGANRSDDYAHLAAADRQAILEILLDTHPEIRAAFAKMDNNP